MFKLEDFKAEILKDNPTYERVKSSDLSALVAVVSKSGFTAATVAARPASRPPGVTTTTPSLSSAITAGVGAPKASPS